MTRTEKLREIMDELNYVSPYNRKERSCSHAKANDKAIAEIEVMFKGLETQYLLTQAELHEWVAYRLGSLRNKR